ncbi:MAG TPA: zinc-ribbon and DUF3426 domain-containing protein [Usitatibacter sp.]
MLITTCSHCRARFRVTPQQLNTKQGQVRCGRCQDVFNGFEALERFPDDDTGARLLAAREAAERGSAPLKVEVEPVSFEELPDIETLQSSDDPAPAPSLVEPPAPVPSTPLPSTRPPARETRHSTITLPEIPRPDPPARAWAFGSALLIVVLAAELAYTYRSPVAQRYPVLRPYFESVCGKVGCTVAWAREEGLLKLEDSELLEVPGKPSEIALNARIRNMAAVAQEFPHIELTLTDVSGQAAIRRVLRPTDYLGRPVNGSEIIAPGAELSIQLRLETPRIKATGYELLLFYP